MLQPLTFFFVSLSGFFVFLRLQRSAVLEHIWNLDDIWSSSLCRVFILQWALMLESKVKKNGSQNNSHYTLRG